MKRQYRYFQNWFPLIISIAVQLIFIMTAFFGGSADFARNLGLGLLYMLVFTTSQTIIGYQSLKLSITQGIIGISPLPPAAKSAWVLLMLSVNSLLMTFTISLALGIMMAIRLSIWGGVILFPVTFIFFFGMPFGISAMLEIAVKMMKPKNPQKSLATIGSLLVVFGLIILSIIAQQTSSWLKWIGTPVIDVGSLNTHAVPVIGITLFIGVLGYSLRIYATLRTSEHIAPPTVKSGNKTYMEKPAPEGLVSLLYWLNSLLVRRKMLEYASQLILLFFFTFFQHQTWMWGIALVGATIGSTMLVGLTGVKGFPLLFLAPISLKKWWHSRLFSVLPLFLVYWVISILLATWSIGHLPLLEIITSLMVAYASLLSNSLVHLVFRERFATDKQKKRRTVMSTFFPIITTVLIPIVLSGLAIHFLFLTLILSIVVIFSTYWIGNPLLDRSKKLRYFWHH